LSGRTPVSIFLSQSGLRPTSPASAADLVGTTCLARGAEQAFADAVLELGGALEVVVPASDYFTGISDPDSRNRCEGYLRAAVSTITMPYQTCGPAAYLCASQIPHRPPRRAARRLGRFAGTG
jgi:hypothetical protein